MAKVRGSKKFMKLIRKWKTLWWVNSYDLDVNFVDKLDEDYESAAFDAAAEITYDSSYNLAVLSVDIPSLKNPNLETIACHEMAHLVLAPIDKYVGHIIKMLPEDAQTLADKTWSDLKENTTTHLTDVGLSLENRRR